MADVDDVADDRRGTVVVAAQAWKRRKTTLPLWPPKPKEFDSTTSTFGRARFADDDVESDVGVDLGGARGRRDQLVDQREHRDDAFEGAGRGERVTEVALDRRHRGAVVTEDRANGDGLGEVVERRRRAVRVDVRDLARP